ncbi:MAG: hypothetical protein M3P42_00385 [Actinomycetota bacterium]|nr:hypothetical protein [Actinomycetota bacterium]
MRGLSDRAEWVMEPRCFASAGVWGRGDDLDVTLRLLMNVAALLMVGAISPTLSSSADETRRGHVLIGGTTAQKLEVRKALDASAFNWHVVPVVVKIRIVDGPKSWARRGEIHLSAELLDKGRASWGTVQHEFAHQVDLYLLDDADRKRIRKALGGYAWLPKNKAVPHAERGAERFASTFAWAYWQSQNSSMRPRSAEDESAAMKPAQFRALLARVLP